MIKLRKIYPACEETCGIAYGRTVHSYHSVVGIIALHAHRETLVSEILPCPVGIVKRMRGHYVFQTSVCERFGPWKSVRRTDSDHVRDIASRITCLGMREHRILEEFLFLFGIIKRIVDIRCVFQTSCHKFLLCADKTDNQISYLVSGDWLAVDIIYRRCPCYCHISRRTFGDSLDISRSFGHIKTYMHFRLHGSALGIAIVCHYREFMQTACRNIKIHTYFLTRIDIRDRMQRLPVETYHDSVKERQRFSLQVGRGCGKGHSRFFLTFGPGRDGKAGDSVGRHRVDRLGNGKIVKQKEIGVFRSIIMNSDIVHAVFRYREILFERHSHHEARRADFGTCKECIGHGLDIGSVSDSDLECLCPCRSHRCRGNSEFIEFTTFESYGGCDQPFVRM